MNATTAPAASAGFACVLKAWHAYEAQLLNYLTHQLGDRAQAQDLLQEVFLKSMRMGTGFCALDNPRAWLYQVAKTTLIDHHRCAKPAEELPGDLAALQNERAPVDELDVCLLRNLQHLGDADRSIVQTCDLQGQTLREYAQASGLTLAATKSRLLRARQRLRQLLLDNCQVRFDDSGQVCCHAPNAADKQRLEHQHKLPMQHD